jgi:hypothetical protein
VARSRPHHTVRTERTQIILEPSRLGRRRPGSDKWLNSGGVKGSTEHWKDNAIGVRKRYGKCILQDGGAPMSYAMVRACSVALWVTPPVGCNM